MDKCPVDGCTSIIEGNVLYLSRGGSSAMESLEALESVPITQPHIPTLSLNQTAQSLVSPRPYSCSFSGFDEGGSSATDKLPPSVIPTQNAPINPPFLPAQQTSSIPQQQTQSIPVSYTTRQTQPITPCYQSDQLPKQQQAQQTYPETMPTQQAQLNTHFNPQQQSQPNPAPYTTQHPPPNRPHQPQSYIQFDQMGMPQYMYATGPYYSYYVDETRPSSSRVSYAQQQPNPYPTRQPQQTYQPRYSTQPGTNFPVGQTSSMPRSTRAPMPPTSFNLPMPPPILPQNIPPLPPIRPSTSALNVPVMQFETRMCTKCNRPIQAIWFASHVKACHQGRKRKSDK
uniref:C2H2-type domain-containing protein n=1 Tax=Meloidogyne javanica TaxID=6303 RepID=A0A915N119_MELJA